MAVIIDGVAIANECKDVVKECIRDLGIVPTVAVISVGDDEASGIYVRNKKKDCEECGINFVDMKLPENIGQSELLKKIHELNEESDIDGIVCQLPLPDGYDYDANEVGVCIRPEKDLDGMNPYNIGSVTNRSHCYIPCTANGVMIMLAKHRIDVSGKHCVVVGTSNIVGRPIGMLLLNKGATVTMCNSSTRDLQQFTRQADVLVVAVGKKNIITKDMVKDGAVVIDVGINRDDGGNLCGDVDFDAVKEVASYITPVPGGCGQTTRAALLLNIVSAACMKFCD